VIYSQPCTRLIATAVPVLTQATVPWSWCQTITGVTVQPVGSNILVSLSPGIGGCSSQGMTGAITFSAGQLGLATGDLSGLLGLQSIRTRHASAGVDRRRHQLFLLLCPVCL